MAFVHYCGFCGEAGEAEGATRLEPSCSNCGCALETCRSEEWPAVRAGLTGTRPPRSVRHESMGPLVAVTAGPFLLPFLGFELGDLAFAAPLILLIFAAVYCFAAAGRVISDRGAWHAYGVTAALGATACLIAVGGAIADTGTYAAFYFGTLASGTMVVGLTIHARSALRTSSAERLLDAGLLVLLVFAICGYFLVRPGFETGDTVLTYVLLVDMVALSVAGTAALTAADPRQRAILRCLLGAAVCVVVADGAVCAYAAGQISPVPGLVAVGWAGAGFLIAQAAGIAKRISYAPRGEISSRRWLVARVISPMSVLALLPASYVLDVLSTDALDGFGAAWFGGAFAIALVMTVARLGYILVDHRKAMLDERALREDAIRRNEELEALTGLATTMTQTLEEAPIVEQALDVLHLAARASSSALHVRDEERLMLRASAGAWSSEHPWADSMSRTEAACITRGGRQVTRIPLEARGHDLGTVTLIRPAADPLTERDLQLLSLLVDQMAVAVQNARDYREKLEQAVRDPLTGAYNRRFFFEALEKEVQRSLRYGSPASLVMFDVDDFKRINDTRGHSVGDDVLRGVTEIAADTIREVDSFARIGGEEFALLLPETEKLDALLVAERLRTRISRANLAPGIRVTVSAGVGACTGDAESRDELVRRVDSALYWAKRNGKDLCAVVSEATDATDESAPPDREGAAAHLATLVAAIDAQHLHTRDHSENVALYAVTLGRSLGLDTDRLSKLRRAALLHDVGKVAVRPEVLEKPAALTQEEMGEIRLHPTVGATMLHHAGLVEEAAWVRHHHERFDGAGYPFGCAGEDIPIEARIIFVADSFEAMTSDRPYRAGIGVADALAELRRCAGTQFEPRLVEEFCSLVERGDLTVMALRAAA